MLALIDRDGQARPVTLSRRPDRLRAVDLAGPLQSFAVAVGPSAVGQVLTVEIHATPVAGSLALRCPAGAWLCCFVQPATTSQSQEATR